MPALVAIVLSSAAIIFVVVVSQQFVPALVFPLVVAALPVLMERKRALGYTVSAALMLGFIAAAVLSAGVFFIPAFASLVLGIFARDDARAHGADSP